MKYLSTLTLLDPQEIAKESTLLRKLQEYGLNHLEYIPNTGWNYALDQVWMIKELESYFRDKEPNKLILVEVGCGKSVFHNFLEDTYHTRIIGIDRPQGFCNPKEFRNVDYFIDFRHLTDLDPNSVDVIFWLSSIEHNPLDEMRELFNKSINLLKEGGILLATLAIGEETSWFVPSEQTILTLKDAEKLFGVSKIYNEYEDIHQKYRQNVLLLKERYQRRYGHFDDKDPLFIVGGLKTVKLEDNQEREKYVLIRGNSAASSTNNVNVLFYIEPMMTFNRPLFHLPWWNFAYRKMLSLENDPDHRYSFRVITSKAIRDHIKGQETLSDCEVIGIDSFSLLKYFDGDYLKASLAWYHQTDTPTQRSYAETFIKQALGNWKPDLVISYSPAPFIHSAFPDALILYSEYGMTSRPPFPESFYFDPYGYYQYNYLCKHADMIRTTTYEDQDFQALETYRIFFINLIESNNPFKDLINKIRPKYKKLILVPLQASQCCSFDGNCNYSSQFQMVEIILNQVPETTGVIFSPHPDFPIFTSEITEYFTKKYPHFIYSAEFERYGSASQYLIHHVDAVASVSSMVGLQALIWKKKLIALGNSQLNFIADAFSLDNLNNLLDQEYQTKDNVLIWLLTQYYVPISYITDSAWFGNYIQRAITHWRNKEELKNFYAPFDRVSNVLDSIITTSNENIPVVKSSTGDSNSYAQLYISGNNQNFTEQESYSTPVLESAWQQIVFKVKLKETNSRIYFRFDPLNKPGMIEISQITVESKKGSVLWQANQLTGFSSIQVDNTAKILSCAQTLCIFSSGNDPQCLFPPLDMECLPYEMIVKIYQRVHYDYFVLHQHINALEKLQTENYTNKNTILSTIDDMVDDRLIELLPKIDHALQQVNHENIMGAIQEIEEVLRVAPDHPWIIETYGSLLLFAKRIDEARRQYQRCIKLEPSFLPAYVGLARTAIQMGDLDEAQEILYFLFDKGLSPQETKLLLEEYSEARKAGKKDKFPLLFGILDKPMDGEVCRGELPVYGWVLSAKLEKINIHILIDYQLYSINIKRGPRPDVMQEYPQYQATNSLPGFGTELDTTSISNGWHILTCVAVQGKKLEIIGQAHILTEN